MSNTLVKRLKLFAALIAIPFLPPSPVVAETSVDPVCATLVDQGPGLYIKPAFATTATRIDGPIPYDRDARIYVVPRFSPLSALPNQELVWHVRMRTTASSPLKSNQVYVYRSRVQTQCRRGERVKQSDGQWFEEFYPDERYISLRRYDDHHNDEQSRREDGGLAKYFHFEVSNSSSNSCYRTDDPKAVGSLREAYGLGEVGTPAPLISPGSPISQAAAEDLLSRKFAGLASLFVYLSGPAPSCFSIAAPVPTSSGFYYQIFSSGRDNFAHDQAHSWNPIQTEFDLHVLPKGKHYSATIDWRQNGRSGNGQ
jgi:hypothetical protein